MRMIVPLVALAALPSCLTTQLWSRKDGRLVEVQHTANCSIELTGEAPDGGSLVLAAKPDGVWRLWPVAGDELAWSLLRQTALSLETLAVEVVRGLRLDPLATDGAALRLGGPVDFAGFGRPATATERLMGLLASPRSAVAGWFDAAVARIEGVDWERITGVAGRPRVAGWRAPPSAKFTPAPPLPERVVTLPEQMAAFADLSMLLAIEHDGDADWFVLDAAPALLVAHVHLDAATPPHWSHESNWRPQDCGTRRVDSRPWPRSLTGTMQVRTTDLVRRRRTGRTLGRVLLTPFTLVIDGVALLAQLWFEAALDDDESSFTVSIGRGLLQSAARAARHVIHR
jgi:hypothetical protein